MDIIIGTTSSVGSTSTIAQEDATLDRITEHEEDLKKGLAIASSPLYRGEPLEVSGGGADRRSHRMCESVDHRAHQFLPFSSVKGAMDLSGFEFLKIILDVSFDRLKLPEKFAELLKGREPREMMLLEADAGSDSLFVMEVLVNGANEIFLGHGWKQFAQTYSLDIGYVLFFTYDGINTLAVKVFEPTMCRRLYHYDNTADPNIVMDKFCVLPKGVSLDYRQETFVKDCCVKDQPKIPFYICKIVQAHIDEAKGKMYFNQEYTRTHLSNFLSTAGAIDVKIYDITNEKIGDFSMKIGKDKKATITHKWLSVTTGQKWDVGDIVMFYFRRHGENSLRLDVQKI